MMEPQGAALVASVEQEMAWPVVARVLAVRAVQAVLVGPEVQVALVERAGVMAALAPAVKTPALVIQAPAIQAVATRAAALPRPWLLARWLIRWAMPWPVSVRESLA
ncbi:hypothetical protein U9R80_02805 [Pseudomonas sp. JQ170C]|uniref:hypothetical protein n=1 Tax=unclassified Pseudomonas TaxID=196821 RepID=UPI00265A5E98|nr:MULTISPECIES: hypothetical protein [unclassified Pseudomonas]WRO76632.1 hypothetical protein U9R80_02805 [Pseudomonas sp. 170C]